MPLVPLAVLALVMTGAPSAILIVTAILPVPLALVADTEELYDPSAVGVPETKPVLVSTLRPGGKAEAPKLAGLLLAVIW